MKFPRLQGLTTVSVCVLCSAVVFVSSATAQKAQTPPAQTPQTPPPAKPNPQNPFETVPTQKEPAPGQPQQPKLEAPPAAPAQAPPTAAPGTPADVIEDIEFRGSRRVPQDTLRAIIFSRKGDKFDEEALRRDFMALWNTSRFDDIRIEREPGKTGWIIRFILTERRVVRSIKYEGNKSITVSEILDRFKERKVGLSVESQYDPNKVQHAVNVLKEYEAERGRQFATVDAGYSPGSSFFARGHVQSGRRAEGEGRQYRRSGQHRLHRQGRNPGDEEPASHRRPALTVSGKSLRQEFRFDASWSKIRTWSGTSIRSTATSRRAWWITRSRSSMWAAMDCGCR